MHLKWHHFRYKLFRYRALEQRLAREPGRRRFLDIGCGDGENMLLFRHLPLQLAGLEVAWSRLKAARQLGLAVLQASGTQLPFPDDSWDMIYIAHVLHHVGDYQRLMTEITRCLAPGGIVFVLETVTDNPLLRLGRKVRPVWRGDEVEAEWRYAELTEIIRQAGFEIEESDRYNLIFFLWEMAPLAFWPLEIFTPIFVYVDLLLARFFKGYSVHCYYVLRRTDKT